MGSHLDALRVHIKMEDYRVANEDTSNEVMEKNERENAEVQSKKETNEKVVQQSSNEKSAEKPKKKVKKVNVKVTAVDHDETDKAQDQQEKNEMGGMGDTLFILDLMRQRKEKLMRKKKDEMINDMAMKKKQQMMEARMGKRVLTRPATGGFMGVNAILAGSKHTSPAMRRRTPKPREIEPDINIPGPDNTEMLIMGIIRDKKEEKYHEAHQVKMEQAGVPSDEKCLAKFGD